ncbi:MAG: redox-sensing transcriptional repressor Rex [Bacteroidales bacterium]|nr:redox-sensing transcriptional repressor Rex [Bacteroidales bacterium]
MNENNSTNGIMKTTMNRLPLYYNFIIEKQRENLQNVSSAMIAKSLKLNNIQVRKDLASISSIPGKPRVGFDVETILNDLERVLGCKNLDEVILVGVGRLGRTLLNYNGFHKYNLDIVASFDVDKDKVGAVINGKPVFGIETLKSFVEEHDIKIGIITVSGNAAQKVCDMLVDAGIKAIWNFAPVHLELPDGIIIKHENLAASLALLTQRYEKSQSHVRRVDTQQ